MKLWHARLLVVAGAAGLAIATPSRAADEDVAPPSSNAAADTADTATSTVPGADPTKPAPAAEAGAKIAALIRQLGATDFKEREAAVEQLKAIGRDALPALEGAAASSDPEVAGRADAVIRHIQRPPVPARLPGPARAGARVGARGQGVRVRMTVENGVRRVDVREPGRTIRIDEGPDGIRMSVTGQEGGREVTREFEAASRDDLRLQNPEAFELYDRWAGRVGDRLGRGRGVAPEAGVLRLHRGGDVFVGPVPDEWRPLGPQPGDELAALRERLERQMHDANLRDDDRREIIGLLERLRAARRAGAANPFADAAADADARDEVNREMDAFNRQADALRGRLKDLALPDPGEALPPPAGARLGITVLEDPDEGVTVVHIMPDGRAARLGVEPLDVIKRVNGADVTDAKSLRRAVTEAKPPLVVEGTRDGEPLKLEEKVEPKAEQEAPAGETPAAEDDAKPGEAPAADEEPE